MLAYQLGANSVVLTDGDPVSIDLIKENLTLNNMEDQRIQTIRMLWGDNEENERFHSWYQNTFHNRHSSSSECDDEDDSTTTFDMIVAGDVMYKSSLPELFFQTVVHYLKESGILYLCHVSSFL